ncbi:phospholipid scramblase 1-like isoform X2 [Anoplophora glabripennis]|uniref:phospholipid scramblase 1-like isoform X2 n=1 Tax=Anoplophora glabripennis TaxID=217634 RepID=UPI0008755CD2|nr:phospholipid scramblase 1-like isoform X2 [Anoplophora glabripennis]
MSLPSSHQQEQDHGRMCANVANIYKEGNYPFASAPPPAFGPYGYQCTQLLHGVSEPITEQPLGPEGAASLNEVYLNPAQSIVNCFPGLEKLAEASELVVRQNVEILEVSPRFKSKFTVKNNFGQKIYHPVEDSDYANQCCGALSASDMIILDDSKKEVLSFHRPFGCGDCWSIGLQLQTMTVSASHDIILGTVEQEMTISYNFVVKNAGGDIVLRIVGPYSPYFLSMVANVDFQIKSSRRSAPIGKITKEWSSSCQSAYNLRITFPLDLAVEIKATLLGACFLIDAMFFQSWE